MRLHHKPFAIRRIAFVPHALAPILWPSDFGPDHRVLLRIDPIRRNHNWLKSLSFFFSQTLRRQGRHYPLPTTHHSLRQRNELRLVARHRVEAGELPVGLGLLDALLARRHEIPPDMTRSIH